MNQPAMQGRFEAKFLGPEILSEHIQYWLRAHEWIFKPAHPDRYIHNIYFDTTDLLTYSENLAGATERTKIRYRWYSTLPQAEIGLGQLEIKNKRNNLGTKKVFKIKENPYQEHANYDQIIKNITAQSPLEGRYWLNHAATPVLINRYLREYYQSQLFPVRATLDTHLMVWDQRCLDRPNMERHSLLLPKHFILEVKFAPALRKEIAHMFNHLSLRMSRSSKYVNGMRSIFMY